MSLFCACVGATLATTAGTTVTTSTPTALWQLMSTVDQVKLDCPHLNIGRDDNPPFDIVYDTLAECQNACATLVPSCNSVNYAPADVPNKKTITKGKCQFQYCDTHYEPRYFGTKHYLSFIYHGPMVKRSTTAPTSTTSTTYGADGWRQVGTVNDVDLHCQRLNDGPNHNYAKDGPRYDDKFDTLDQCKVACRDKVRGCDAINYSKDKKGKCQFQQCKGVIQYGNVRDFDSYFLKPGVATTVAGCTGKCVGDLTCDQLSLKFMRTCAQLETSFESCDCSSCVCPNPQVTHTTTTSQSYPYKWIKYSGKDCIGDGAQFEVARLNIGDNGKDFSFEKTLQQCKQTCAASKNCAGFVDKSETCRYYFYIPPADKLKASTSSDCYRYAQPLSSSTTTTTTPTTTTTTTTPTTTTTTTTTTTPPTPPTTAAYYYSSTTTPSTSTTTSPTTVALDATNAQSSNNNKKTPKSAAGAIVAVLIVILVIGGLIVGGFVYFKYFKKSSTDLPDHDDPKSPMVEMSSYRPPTEEVSSYKPPNEEFDEQDMQDI